MRRLVLFVLIVAALVAAAVWLADDPGAISLVWRGWRVDTSVGVLVAAFLVTLLVALFVLRLIAGISGRLRGFLARRREHRVQRGLESLGGGFAAVQAGQGDLARRFAKEAAALLDNNPATLILRKDAAALNGDMGEMQNAAAAMLARRDTELAGLRALATKSLAEGNVVDALNHARRALARKDAPVWAMRMALDAEISTERWADAIAALDSRLGRQAFTRVEHARLMSELLVRQSDVLLHQSDAGGAAVAAKKAMGAGGHTRGPVVAFARAMAAQGRGKKAAHAVERAWADAPHGDLLAAYKILVPGESALDWAKRIENLVQAAPEHIESRLAVAEASLQAELWGQARSRLSGLTAETMPSNIRARAAHLLAELERRQRGDAEAAADWLRLALEFHRAPGGKRVARTAEELLAS
jgi:HemY protein